MTDTNLIVNQRMVDFEFPKWVIFQKFVLTEFSIVLFICNLTKKPLRTVLLFAPYIFLPLVVTIIFRRFRFPWNSMTYLITGLCLFTLPFGVIWVDDYLNPALNAAKCANTRMSYMLISQTALLPIALLLQFAFNKLWLRDGGKFFKSDSELNQKALRSSDNEERIDRQQMISLLCVSVIALLTWAGWTELKSGPDCLASLGTSEEMYSAGLKLCSGNFIFKIMGIFLGVFGLVLIWNNTKKFRSVLYILWIYTVIALVLALPIYHIHGGFGGGKMHGHQYWDTGHFH